MDELARAAEVLGSATDVALACHLNPDADALGSMLGLAAFLRQRGTATVCSFPNEPLVMPRWAALLPGSEDLVEVRRLPRRAGRHGHVRLRVLRPARSARAGRVQGDGAHLDRPSPVERRARHHPADRSRGVVHVRDGLPADRSHGGSDAGRHRGVPVRGARDGHGPVPVRGHDAGDPPDRRDAPRAPLRPFEAGAGPLRGQRRGSSCGSRRSPWRGPASSRRRTSSGRTSPRPICRRPASAPDDTDDLIDLIRTGPRRRRRGRAQAATGRAVQGQHPLPRRARSRGRRRRLRRRRASARGRVHLGARSRGHDRAAGRRPARSRARHVTDPEGLLLVDKPGGMTSHDVVDVVRRRLGTRKVGHAGTLDPMATGLLVLGVGRATRLLRFLGDLPKTYEGTARLGVETTTLDADGEVTAERPVTATEGDDRGRDGGAGGRFPAGAAGLLGREGRRPQAVRGRTPRRAPGGGASADPRRCVRADRDAWTGRGLPGRVLRRHLRPGAARRRRRGRSGAARISRGCGAPRSARSR